MTSVNLLQRCQSQDEVDLAEMPYDARTLIWIGVQPDSITKTDADDFVTKIASLLKMHSVDDVYVELHESSIEQFSSPQFLANRPRSEFRHLELPFQLGVGLSIAPLSQRSSRATASLFIRLDGLEDIFLITCQHALTTDSSAKVSLGRLDEGELITLMSEAAYEDAVDDIDAAVEKAEAEIQETTRAILGLDPADEITVEAESRRLVQAQGKRQQLLDLRQTVNDSLCNRKDRILGSVACHPAINESSRYTTKGFDPEATISFISDWGLIKLNPDIMTHGATSLNTIHLPEKPSRRSGFEFELGVINNLAVKVAKATPLSENYRRPTPCYMQGAATSVSTGHIHPIVAVIREKRQYDEDGVETIFFHDSLVVPIQGMSGQDFSAGGDSGGLVVDQRGQAEAIIMAGNRVTKITYALPVALMLQHIEHFTGRKPHLV
jgi:hypothetical protein